jgi:small subunit ribosomal protein S21
MQLDENDAMVESKNPNPEDVLNATAEAAENDEREGEGHDDERRPRRKAESFGETVQCRPLEVLVKDDRVEQAIRQLKNRLAREGVLRELKNRRHYFKPSELKRIKSREAARRRRKQARQKPRTK